MKVKKHPRKKVILTWDKPTKIDNKQLAGLNQCTMNLKNNKKKKLKTKKKRCKINHTKNGICKVTLFILKNHFISKLK